MEYGFCQWGWEASDTSPQAVAQQQLDVDGCFGYAMLWD